MQTNGFTFVYYGGNGSTNANKQDLLQRAIWNLHLSAQYQHQYLGRIRIRVNVLNGVIMAMVKWVIRMFKRALNHNEVMKVYK